MEDGVERRSVSLSMATTRVKSGGSSDVVAQPIGGSQLRRVRKNLQAFQREQTSMQHQLCEFREVLDKSSVEEAKLQKDVDDLSNSVYRLCAIDEFHRNTMQELELSYKSLNLKQFTFKPVVDELEFIHVALLTENREVDEVYENLCAVQLIFGAAIESDSREKLAAYEKKDFEKKTERNDLHSSFQECTEDLAALQKVRSVHYTDVAMSQIRAARTVEKATAFRRLIDAENACTNGLNEADILSTAISAMHRIVQQLTPATSQVLEELQLAAYSCIAQSKAALFMADTNQSNLKCLLDSRSTDLELCRSERCSEHLIPMEDEIDRFKQQQEASRAELDISLQMKHQFKQNIDCVLEEYLKLQQQSLELFDLLKLKKEAVQTAKRNKSLVSRFDKLSAELTAITSDVAVFDQESSTLRIEITHCVDALDSARLHLHACLEQTLRISAKVVELSDDLSKKADVHECQALSFHETLKKVKSLNNEIVELEHNFNSAESQIRQEKREIKALHAQSEWIPQNHDEEIREFMRRDEAMLEREKAQFAIHMTEVLKHQHLALMKVVPPHESTTLKAHKSPAAEDESVKGSITAIDPVDHVSTKETAPPRETTCAAPKSNPLNSSDRSKRRVTKVGGRKARSAITINNSKSGKALPSAQSKNIRATKNSRTARSLKDTQRQSQGAEEMMPGSTQGPRVETAPSIRRRRKSLVSKPIIRTSGTSNPPLGVFEFLTGDP